MARSLNKAILIGNLGADPEIRTTSSGQRVAQFSLATGRSWTNARGETQERTEWHRVVVWGKLVDVVEAYVKKGERIYVEGEIQYRSFEDAEGGTRYVTEINARELLMLGGRSDESAAEPQPPAPTQAATERVSAKRGRRPAPAVAEADYVNGGEDDLPF